MAESHEYDSRPPRGGSRQDGQVALAEREPDDLITRTRSAVSDLAGESAPRWSFGAPEPFAHPEGGPARPADVPPGTGEPRRASFGPAGKHRSPAAVVALSMLTLGLSSLIWHHRVNCEMGDFDPRLRVRPARSAWALSIPWLLGLATTLAGVGLLIERHRRPEQVAMLPGWLGYALLAGVLAVPYLTLLLPFGSLAVVMTLERLRLVQEHIGVPGDVQLQPVREVARLLIPVTGGLLLQLRQQSALDDVWEWADTAPNRRRRRA
ncbi:MAG: hypothetical protein ABR541_05150 [Candidatus Dormibacteria bacterium]